jgi:anti-sigma regulatory factor (Ser/Thr protein kinase)
LRWRKVIPGQEREVRTVRRWIAELLPDCPSRDDVMTVAVELATNAVKFTASGRGRADGVFAIEVTWHATAVRVAVADAGAPQEPRLVNDPDTEHGRGLHIVQSLATRFGVCGDTRGRLVWADLPWTGEGPAAQCTEGHEASIRDGETLLTARYGIPAWYGRATLQWWALPSPGGALVTAPSAGELARLIDNATRARSRQQGWAAQPGTTRAGWRPKKPAAPAAPRRHLSPLTVSHLAFGVGADGGR